MRRTRTWRTRWGVVGLLAGLAGFGPLPASSQDTGEGEGPTVIYLVRHAERATDHPSDPSLSSEGEARARELARLLKDAPLDRIFSTDFRRTRLTAAPVAETHGLGVDTYDPRGEGMGAFADLLRTNPGHILVVGHSNTTPDLVEALGGDPVSPIEEMEYDRIYLVVVDAGGRVTSTLLRFGERSAPEG